MELDELKNVWKQQDSSVPERQVQQALARRSNTPIAKMKRNLLVELILVVVLYSLVAVYYLTAWDGKWSFVSLIYLVIGSLFCVYYYKKRKLLNEMECMACQVKRNLSKQVEVLEKYVRFYLLAGTALIPVFMMLLYLFEWKYIQPSNAHLFNLPSETVSVARSVGELAIILVVTTFIFYFIYKWYVRKLYGNYVEKLKDMLNQMEDDTVLP